MGRCGIRRFLFEPVLDLERLRPWPAMRTTRIERVGCRLEGELCFASDVAAMLQEITANAGEAAALIAKVATANVQQADGIGQLNRAFEQMNNVTQSNAAGAVQTASASSEITAQARELSDLADALTVLVKGNKV